MSSNITKVAVIGTGVIGAGWIIRALAHNKKVTAFDKDIKLKKKLIREIKRTWPYVKKLFNKKKLNLNKLKFVDSIKEAVKDADFIQECATENYSLKTKLMHNIGKYNIRVNAICPGTIKGDRMKRVIRDKAKFTKISAKKIENDFVSMASMNSWINEEDIGNMCAYLISDYANKISGQVIAVDGNAERMD